MTNTQFYEQFRAVPQEAQKKITGGRLSGFTDINPMWRIKSLTEVFGPVGFGWYTEIIERWTETCESNEEIAAFVKINLYVKVDGEWSKPIVGVGGSKAISIEKGAAYLNDEVYKMAYTDALSIACKALGMGADIYYAKDCKSTDNRTKYDMGGDAPQGGQTGQSRRQPAASTSPAPQAAAPLSRESELYWKIVSAYVDGKRAKSGNDYRTDYIVLYHPTPEQIADFDHDVENVRAARNGGQ